MKAFIASATFLISVLGVHAASTPNRSQNTLIIGGQPATQGQFPYQLQLLRNESLNCGASLIQVDQIQVALTAAHCVYPSETELYSLVAGELDTEVVSGFEQTKRVTFLTRHANYSNLQYDISILFFNGTFELNQNVQLIPLPARGQVTLGNVTVSGWGLQDRGPNPPRPTKLHYISIPVVSNEECAEAWDKYFNTPVLKNQLCAGESTGNVSQCYGDSGGPAKSTDGYLAGVVSRSYECGHPDYPAIFTKVSHFIDWIEDSVASYKLNTHI